ncbi:MAG: hypothetical protein HOO01_01730 [Cellvibrionales bacterium]|jgi:hypothetical protein|nr:hypothetical protein [Cellvibrionales bacterium]MBT6578961.1 hypothetical protein [Cellvibrionales bacterium]
MLDYLWVTYHSILLPLTIGLLISGSLFLLLGLSSNSRKIPLERVLIRSSGVVPLTFRIWFIPAVLTCITINEVPWLQSFFMSHLQLNLAKVAILVALFLPQIGWLKLLGFKLPFNQSWLASLANILIRLGEATVGYPQKIIDREVTKIKTEFLPPDHDLCVAKAYEFHRVEVAKVFNKKPYEEFIRLKNKSVKIDHLMRFLGCDKFHFLMKKIQADQAIILPTWYHNSDRRKKPVSSRRESDRRLTSAHCDSNLRVAVKDRREIPHWGRRRADSPYAHHFVLRKSH